MTAHLEAEVGLFLDDDWLPLQPPLRANGVQGLGGISSSKQERREGTMAAKHARETEHRQFDLKHSSNGCVGSALGRWHSMLKAKDGRRGRKQST